jgi:hypothetical protein
MAQAAILTPMEQYTKDSLKMIIKMGKEYITTQIKKEALMAFGLIINSMVSLTLN